MVALTMYVPGSVSLFVGLTMKIGYFPVVKKPALPQSTETILGVSSGSISNIDGNLS